MAADFNPIAPEVQPTDFDRYSRGVPDSNTFRTLFGGVSNIVDSSVKAKDEANQNKIYEDTLSTTQKLQQPYIDALNSEGGASPGVSDSYTPHQITGPSSVPDGVGAAPRDPMTAPPGPPPAALTSSQQQMSRLQLAMNAGTISDSYYHNQLDSMVRNLRVQFPGYDQEIDRTVQNVTGITPANALMTDYFQQVQKNAALNKESANNWQTYVNAPDNRAAIVNSGLSDVYTNPDKYTDPTEQSKVRLAVATVGARQATLQATDAQIARQKSLGGAVGDATEKAAYDHVGAMTGQVFTAAGNSTTDLYTKLHQLQESKNPDPQAVADLQSGIAQAQTALVSQVHQYLYSPQTASDGSVFTVAGDIGDKSKVDAIEASAMAPLKDAMDQVTNAQYGIASYSARVNQMTSDSTSSALLKATPSMAVVAAQTKLLGPNFVNWALADAANDTPGSPNEATMLRGILKQQAMLAVTGGQDLQTGGSASLSGTLRTWKTDQNVSVNSKDISDLIQNSMDVITKSDAPAEAKANAIQYLYGSGNADFLNQFGDQSKVINNNTLTQRTQVYNKMVNPAVTQQIFDATRDNPQLFQQYSQWAASNFKNLFMANGAEIQNAITDRPYVHVVWNPKTYQMSVQTDTQPIPDQPGVDPLVLAQNRQDQTTATSVPVQNLNLAISGVAKMITLNGGNPNIEIMKLLTDIGVDPKSPKTAGSFADAMYRAMGAKRDAIQSGDVSAYGNYRGPR